MASINSSPLFISVAQSMVIFSPMLQLGWRRASVLVFPATSSRLKPKNGPPEQVFRVTPDEVDVVIHRQSIIHSMVEFRDGAVLRSAADSSTDPAPAAPTASGPDRSAHTG